MEQTLNRKKARAEEIKQRVELSNKLQEKKQDDFAERLRQKKMRIEMVKQ